MRAMSAQEEFKLEPNGMVRAKQLSMVVIILQTNFREFARIKRQHWRNPDALAAKNVGGIKNAVVAVGVLAAQPGDPTGMKAPERLRIKTPIAQGFGGKAGGRIRAGFKHFVKPLGLPGHKWKAGVRVGGLPFPIH